MRAKGQEGFTILETMLFLSITGLMFIGLVSGIQYMIYRARFSDAVSGLQTTIKAQFEEVRDGINTRSGGITAADICKSGTTSTDAPGSASCLVLGKIIRFEAGSSSIRINYVIGNDVDLTASLTDAQALAGANTRISTIGAETKQIDWGATYVKGFPLAGEVSGKSYRSIAILRSPVSNSLLVYAFPDPVADSVTNLVSTGQLNIPIAMIIKNPTRGGAAGGAVCIDGGSTSAGVNTTTISKTDQTFSATNNDMKKINEDCSK